MNSGGSKSARPLAVQLTDETGKPLEAVAVSFRLPEEGPSGSFESGMKTEIVITGADGRAAAYGLRYNRITGPFQIRITAAKGDSRAGAICSQYITDAPASKLEPGSRSGKLKWIAIVAAAAGGAAAAGLAVGKNTAQQQTGGPPSTPGAAQPVQIGPPTISIARP